MSHAESYVLTLNEDLAWILSGTTGTRSWLIRLADIMELPRSEDTESSLPRVTFIRGNAASNSLGNRAGPPDFEQMSCLRSQGLKATELTFVVTWYHPTESHIYCELLNADNHYLDVMMMAQSVFPFYKAATEQGGMPVHCALVEKYGGGVLLVGRGGMGKSTCCRRLPSSWKVLCDDETLVVRNRCDWYSAHPFPTWGDYLYKRSKGTWNVTKSVPLSAVFFLDRAEVDSVHAVGRGEAALLLHQSATQVCARHMDRLADEDRKEWQKSLFESACDMAKSIPAFKLKVSRQGAFWREIETVL